MSSQPAEHVSQAVLLDGSVVSLRRLAPDDVESVIRLYETLSDDECYLRFFTLHPADLQARARSLTGGSTEHYALGAFDCGKLIGVANYGACKTPGDAEVAVVVAHEEHLRGVGTALLRRLGKAARRRGIHRFVAEVLVENHLMLRVLADAGWPCTRRLDGAVLHIEVDLGNLE
jgi:RimJ/RimL family protein N-acetyltransferase